MCEEPDPKIHKLVFDKSDMKMTPKPQREFETKRKDNNLRKEYYMYKNNLNHRISQPGKNTSKIQKQPNNPELKDYAGESVKRCKKFKVHKTSIVVFNGPFKSIDMPMKQCQEENDRVTEGSSFIKKSDL